MPEESFDDQASLRGIHVFLAVDDPECRELIKTVLEYTGALVSVAASGRATLAALDAIRPDVLLADLSTGTDHAITLIERVRAQPAHARMPAVALTSQGARDGRQRLLKAGFQEHLVKPIDPWELCRLITTLVERA
jgi:CheY-like chemotaxis protein